MAKVFTGDNPSQLYMDALLTLLREGKDVTPRGKKIKEIRPVIFEYTNPKNRVTFLKGRVINPFFQLAEALWILRGRSDVKWLSDYNKSIAQFSDNGIYFNAPYGERLRFWNKNDAHDVKHNSIDQLVDVYKKITTDKDTRQAVAVIYNPLFDNAIYTIDELGKDIPCNMILTFKVRDNKLDLNVFNRSNDLHWGTFGANLCQFATIQEVMASWLGIDVGTYYQTTDSLHIYLEDYGAKETDKILQAYKIDKDSLYDQCITPVVGDPYVFEDEPRFKSSFKEFEDIMEYYFKYLDKFVSSPDTYEEKDNKTYEELMESLEEISDPYLKFTFQSMVAYQAHKKGSTGIMIDALSSMKDCSWKVSCLRFLSKRYGNNTEFIKLHEHLNINIRDYINRKFE